MSAPPETPEVASPSATRFDEWAASPPTQEVPISQAATPQPVPAPIQPAQAPYAPADVDLETQQFVQGRELQLRKELDARFQQQQTATQEDLARSGLWSRFQDRYPEFQGEDDFIAASFHAISGGRLPEAALQEELMSRVYDHAVSRRGAMLERAGYEIVNDDEEPAEGRAVAISDGGSGELSGSPLDPTPEEEEDDDSTLGSTLVELQGKTEFFPDTTDEMLKQYKKGNLR